MDALKEAIRRRHSNWKKEIEGILIFELPTGTGFAHGEPNRIDAFFMSVFPSEGLKRVAYEIKSSRADFRREIKEPRKRRAALRVSNEFYFVAPIGIIPVAEVPLECGLIEVYDDGGITITVKAPYRDSMPSSWHFFAAFARRLLKLEAVPA